MEKYVLVMRYGFFDSREYTLKEIGEMFSVSKQYVEQVEKKAVLKLQKKIDKELGEFL
jgi:DNA-directed RNA polymerase sigma subunit (sigma70/sigma32)